VGVGSFRRELQRKDMVPMTKTIIMAMKGILFVVSKLLDEDSWGSEGDERVWLAPKSTFLGIDPMIMLKDSCLVLRFLIVFQKIGL